MKLSYKDNPIKRDVNGDPIPQYYDSKTKKFEVMTGKDGVLEHRIEYANATESILRKLDELIEAVK